MHAEILTEIRARHTSGDGSGTAGSGTAGAGKPSAANSN